MLQRLTSFIPQDPKLVELREFAKQANMKTQYTPDYYHLRHLRTNLMLVIDETQRGHPGRKLLETKDCHYIGPAFTRDSFSFTKVHTGSRTFPIALQTKFRDCGLVRYPYLPIRGELYMVSAEVICSLDTLKANGNAFIRKNVGIRYPYTKRAYFGGNAWTPLYNGSRPDNAWMYVGDLDKWPVNDNAFRPVQVLRPPLCGHKGLEEYYWFTTMEYRD